eukprot:NODE_5935_length_542_cov_34.204868_g5187_i0.p1 GENE.NODE_5935_length_542_cov_34.204868_g5187_i0~~NODE_5935_length_542_cov_34.204868_g5187_i0.p1  ORF type:complete len:143 (+),score=29.42 NODE_5935_length_542_cov_34.204868_g5187_i0:40-468(+)
MKRPSELLSALDDVANDLQLCIQNGTHIIADYFGREEKLHCGIPSDWLRPHRRPIPLEDRVVTTTTIVASSSRPYSPTDSPPSSPRHEVRGRSVSPPRVSPLSELSPAVRKVLHERYESPPPVFTVQTEKRHGSIGGSSGSR